MNNETNKENWAMLFDKYCAASIASVTEVLGKTGKQLPSKCVAPLANGSRLEIDVTPELNVVGL